MEIDADIAETIVNPEAYADFDRVHDAFAKLRRDRPVGLAAPQGYDPFWVVTRYDDVKQVEMQSDVFHNGARASTLTTQIDDQKVRELTGGSPHLVRSLVQMDAPDHLKYRKLTQTWFAMKNIKAREARIRELARETVDGMLATGGACDFAEDVALRYPLRVIMEVMGVPDEDTPKMLKLTQELFGATDNEMNRDGGHEQGQELVTMLNEVVTEFFGYFTELTEARRKEPRDDLATVIAQAEVDGEPLGPVEAMSYYVLVATAGHDTTSGSTSSAGWALAERPDVLSQVKADPSLIPGLVEESIRWETPVKHFMRTAMEDTEIGGQAVAEGDWLMLSYPSANRDERAFEEPFRFSPARTEKQLAFGHGPHLCLGQHLAKLEMRILWEELLPRVAEMSLDGEPTRVASTFVSGPKRVPIRFKAA